MGVMKLNQLGDLIVQGTLFPEKIPLVYEVYKQLSQNSYWKSS